MVEILKLFDRDEAIVTRPHSFFPGRAATIQDARTFFLYQNSDAITEAYAKMIGADPEDIDLKVDWGQTEDGYKTGGDVLIYRRPFWEAMSNEDMIRLAITMDWGNWVQPTLEPYHAY